MSVSGFRVERPRTVQEAVRLLADHGSEAMLLAGGTDLVPNLQMKLFEPRVVLDLKPIRALRGIAFSPDAGLRIGALTTLAEVLNCALIREQFPVLASAVGTIAGPLQRNMGTIGGNLCLETRCLWYNQSYFWRKALGGCLKHPMPNADAAHPDTICHVAPGGKRCWAVWSGDSAPAFLALDAEVEIAGPRSVRRVMLRDFYRNDGMDRMALGRDELLTAVCVPGRMAGRCGVYSKLRIRNSIDYPLAGVGVSLELDRDGICRDGRVAINAVNPAPLLMKDAADWLVGQEYSPELVARVAQRATQIGKPLTTSASTPGYRREMLKLFTRRALEESWKQRTGP
jgi:4-hydroxybenzoyl-CoA reductase subunit beta